MGDDFPERMAGESDDDYQKRIEDDVFNRICNPDGTLKDEFKDHPDADRLAVWGRQRAEQKDVIAAANRAKEADTPEKQEAFLENENAEVLKLIQRDGDSTFTKEQIDDAIDSDIEANLSQKDNRANLSMFKSFS